MQTAGGPVCAIAASLFHHLHRLPGGADVDQGIDYPHICSLYAVGLAAIEKQIEHSLTVPTPDLLIAWHPH